MNIDNVLKDVMVRLEKQFMVPATFTVKDRKDFVTEVHVFLHGCSTTHYSDGHFFLEMIEDNEHVGPVNILSDYLIEFFIHALREESETDVMSEMVANLEYVYGQMVFSRYWYDQETAKVSFLPIESKVAITMDAAQLKEEYENRFSSEDAPDILVDLADTIKLLYNNGRDEAEDYLNSLNRNITIESFKENGYE